MKNTKILFTGLISLFMLFSCSSEDTPNKKPEELNKIQELSNNSHTVELLSKKQKLTVGSNTVVLKIKDSNSKEYISPENISWKTTLSGKTCCGKDFKREAPTLGLKTDSKDKNLLEGVLFLEKASDDKDTSWELEIQFDYKGKTSTIVDKIIVAPEKTNNKTIQCFKGNDEKSYTIALIEPSSPKIGVNDMKVALFNNDLSIADQYTIHITPSMPSMGHGSPNNKDLTQSESDKLYHGKVNFTMDGYWTINLQIVDKNGDILIGEKIDDTDKNAKSSLFFDIEFKK